MFHELTKGKKMGIMRQAERGTLKVMSGVSTAKVVGRFFGGIGDELLSAPVLLRLQRREVQTADESNLLLLLAATKTRELKRGYMRGWNFRGLRFLTIRGDVPMGIFTRLTPAEIARDNIPKPKN